MFPERSGGSAENTKAANPNEYNVMPPNKRLLRRRATNSKIQLPFCEEKPECLSVILALDYYEMTGFLDAYTG